MHGSKYPPGPRDGVFGIAHYYQIRDNLLGFAEQVMRDHGDFTFVRLGWVRLYFVNRPELIREVLTTKLKMFRKLGKQMKSLRKIEGEGLVVSEGETWSRHRPLVQGSFHARHFERYGQMIVENTARRLDGWKADTPFDLAEEMNELALEIIAKIVFDEDLGGRAAELRDAVHEFRAAMQWEMSRPFPTPDWMPLPGKLRQRRAIQKVNDLLWEKINSRRASGVLRADMLGQMLAAASLRDGDDPITDAEIRDEAATLFVAGHDTTSAALAWFWYALTQNPAAERRAVEEVDAVCGGRTPTLADVPRLKYLEAAAKESMRLYPPSSFLFGREATANVELGGYTVPRGSWVFISPYLVQRNPANFSDPLRYDPERFLPGRSDEIAPYTYLPFGGGPRVCIGNSLATMQLVLMAATVLQRYRLSLDQSPPEPEMEVVLRPKGGLRMKAAARRSDVQRRVAA